MRSYAKKQGIDRAGWDFLATDPATIQTLTGDLGFLYEASSAGFDHLIQTSVLDADGVVSRQIYGMRFATPHLIEPLKALVFGENLSAPLLDRLSARIRLFCTVYDPASDSYMFDYSIFIGLFVGLTMGFICVYLLIREWRYSHSSSAAKLD
jgi:protein SCO1/2